MLQPQFGIKQILGGGIIDNEGIFFPNIIAVAVEKGNIFVNIARCNGRTKGVELRG
jgi:hypothetical protein